MMINKSLCEHCRVEWPNHTVDCAMLSTRQLYKYRVETHKAQEDGSIAMGFQETESMELAFENWLDATKAVLEGRSDMAWFYVDGKGIGSVQF